MASTLRREHELGKGLLRNGLGQVAKHMRHENGKGDTGDGRAHVRGETGDEQGRRVTLNNACIKTHKENLLLSVCSF